MHRTLIDMAYDLFPELNDHFVKTSKVSRY